jgi:iron-sulfur cluster assembly protein
MDFTVDKLSSRFVFRNPNETSACGCGESVTLKPVERESAASRA